VRKRWAPKRHTKLVCNPKNDIQFEDVLGSGPSLGMGPRVFPLGVDGIVAGSGFGPSDGVWWCTV
jgi:hypothetical protein